MINKQSLWFLTLFSLILVLGVYYVTMPNELLVSNIEEKQEKVTDVIVEVTENEYLTALRVEKEDERQTLKVSLEKILNNLALFNIFFLLFLEIYCMIYKYKSGKSSKGAN